MREVVSSAAKAKPGALFHNFKETCPLRIALEELGHLQAPTAPITDKSTASGIANDTVKQRRYKVINMRFYWIRKRIPQGHFILEWIKGEQNLANYFTKYRPRRYHSAICSTYLFDPTNPKCNYFKLLAEDDPNDET
jgi:hypothetical protein